MTGWDYSETERLLSERAEAIAKQREERLRTAAERDIAARIALRCVQALAVPMRQHHRRVVGSTSLTHGRG